MCTVVNKLGCYGRVPVRPYDIGAREPRAARCCCSYRALMKAGVVGSLVSSVSLAGAWYCGFTENLMHFMGPILGEEAHGYCMLLCWLIGFVMHTGLTYWCIRGAEKVAGQLPI